MPYDPYQAPVVNIHSDDHPTTYGPFVAEREATGLFYIDWLVPDDLPTGQWLDVWSFKFTIDRPEREEIFAFDVHPLDAKTEWKGIPKATESTSIMREYVELFNSAAMYDAQHLTVRWEQGQRNFNPKVITFAFGNWNQNPRPEIRLNNRLLESGWRPDGNGKIYFDRNLDPEDNVFCRYNMRYFSEEDILNFLNMGLYMMNTVPPVSENYRVVAQAPFTWRAPILAGARQIAMQRLVIGLGFQERRIVFSEDPQIAEQVVAGYRQEYQNAKEEFDKLAKNAKTLRIPGIAQIVQPEFTMPGGRARWFRLMMHGSA
jgi:hypothetical protein